MTKNAKELAVERMQEVFDHFGNRRRTAQALKVAHQYVYQWDDGIPVNQCLKLERHKARWTLCYLRPDKYEAAK